LYFHAYLLRVLGNRVLRTISETKREPRENRIMRNFTISDEAMEDEMGRCHSMHGMRSSYNILVKKP
jgi:hypothetical protein